MQEIRAIRRTDALVLMNILEQGQANSTRGTIDYAKVSEAALGMNRHEIHEVVKLLVERRILALSFGLGQAPYQPGPTPFRVGMDETVIRLTEPEALDKLCQVLAYAWPVEQLLELAIVRQQLPLLIHGIPIVLATPHEFTAALDIYSYSLEYGEGGSPGQLATWRGAGIPRPVDHYILKRLVAKGVIIKEETAAHEVLYCPGANNLMRTTAPLFANGARVQPDRTFHLVSDGEILTEIQEQASHHPISPHELALLGAGLCYACWPEDEPVSLNASKTWIASVVFGQGQPISSQTISELAGMSVGDVQRDLGRLCQTAVLTRDKNHRYGPGRKSLILPQRYRGKEGVLPPGAEYNKVFDLRQPMEISNT